MGPLKAFVGHSFSPEDEEVVGKFLKYFDQVARMGIGFSWEHAEYAEPKVLADKVLRIIDDKNLFIGICTNKETAIPKQKLKEGLLNKSVFKAQKSEFESKTSDWVIQEIGLAIGRRMNLILLVESGVRAPGGLQGNLEYIEFNRFSPEKAFGKILEMVQALLPVQKLVRIEAVEETKTTNEEQTLGEVKPAEWAEPTEDWTKDKYEVALLHYADEEERSQYIFQKFLDSKIGKEPKERQSLEAWREYIRFLFGKEKSLSPMENLAKEYPDNRDVQHYLGFVYSEYDQEKAARQFELAATKAVNDEGNLESLSKAAISYFEAGLNDSIINVVEKMIQKAPFTENYERMVVKHLRDIAEKQGAKDLFFGFSERLLQLSPDDIDSRFSLAYAYSEDGKDELSLFHYLKIPYDHRSNSAWNNLGVQLSKFELPSKSIKAYRKSEQDGGTLAISNIAYKMIESGFLPEAEEILKKGIQKDGHHKNVDHAMARLKEVPDDEAAKEKKIVDRSAKLSSFFKDYGHSALLPYVGDHVVTFEGPDCILTISINSGRLTATGEYEQASGFGIALPALARGEQSPRRKINVTYSGVVKGRSARCNFSRKSTGETLLSSSPEIEVLMVISASMDNICVLENTGKDAKQYELKRTG